MTELLLTFIIMLSLAVHVWYIKKYHELQKSLINALMSRNNQEYISTEVALKPKEKVKQVESEYMPMSELDDDDFFEAVGKTII